MRPKHGLKIGMLMCLWGACSAEPSDDDSMDNLLMAGVGGAGLGAGVGGLAGTMPIAGDTALAGTTAGMALAGTGGVAGTLPLAGMAGVEAGTMPIAGTAGASGSEAPVLENFSFFVTSLRAMQELSGNQNGFGGDLRYGETGEGAGLRGADKICTEIAEQSMPGSGVKQWRAFLSAVAAGPGGTPVHARDRIGQGPWYDRLGRLFGNNLEEIIAERPTTADPQIVNDFPNEDGVPNHNPDGTGEVDNHDFLTGSDDMGRIYMMDMRVTCDDWTKSLGDSNDAPRVGHSWPRSATPIAFFGGGGAGSGGFPFPGGGAGTGGFPFPGGGAGTGGFPFPGGGAFNGEHWISALDEAGCAPGVSLVEMGPPNEANPTVGSGGGYGGLYCFALQP
jgi:hypothetical protein